MPRPRAPCVVCEEIAEKFAEEHPDEPSLPISEHDVSMKIIPKTPKPDEEEKGVPLSKTVLLCWSHATPRIKEFMGVE
jgi:hypothetical protein